MNSTAGQKKAQESFLLGALVVVGKTLTAKWPRCPRTHRAIPSTLSKRVCLRMRALSARYKEGMRGAKMGTHKEAQTAKCEGQLKDQMSPGKERQ